ncbi:MAG: hypothetical protein IJ374_10885 [Lachnospiraceae bacterium]|nr:hypothetical protein [Lachnospiraceae bacterium]
MKKFMFIFTLAICLLCAPMTGFAAPTEEEKQQYEEAIADKWKEMLKGSIALDKSNAENKTYLLSWLEAETQPKEAKKIVNKIEALEAEQEKKQESMDPYLKAKKTCDEKCNADGANAALENIIRIQKDRLKNQEELTKLWKKVAELLKK